MKMRRCAAGLVLTGLLMGTAIGERVSFAGERSALWGLDGEAWTSQSRLPDFSFAGYHCGEDPLPSVPAGVSVREFGAKGDGKTDDTQAFLDAIAQVESGAIEIPPGRYRITGIMEITRPGIVLRGAGPDQTTLFFPKPLHAIRPNLGATTSGRPTSNYSWSGGFIWVRGSYGSRPLAQVIGAARRGDTTLCVNSAEDIRVGQRVEIRVSDGPDNSLARHLYSDDPGPTDNLQGRTRASLVAHVVAIEGDRLRFDRPLRFDIAAAWKPVIYRFEPTVSEVGVEGLTFEFPETPYEGHFTEQGYNPVALSDVADCWVRNVRVVNADSGPMIGGEFNTVQGLVHESRRRPDARGSTGHHGICLSGDDNLFTEFDYRTRFIHDVTVSHCAGNVIARGRGVDLCFDHHRRAPYENLFTDLDAGAGSRLWDCGGGAALGKHCGARGTFWNIRAARPLSYPSDGFGPWSMNLVAVQSDQPSETDPDGKWFEAIAPADLTPQDLHAAQLSRRLRSHVSVVAEEFTPLFDGRTLAGWKVLPGGRWNVVDGVLVGSQEATESRHGQLLSEREYGNFVIRLKFQALAGNSGLYFRAQPVEHPVSVKGLQAEIDADGNSVGGLYETLGRAWVVQPPLETVQKFYRPKQWNEMTVTAIAGDVTVEINGFETARLRNDPGARRGHFALQLHGGQEMHVLFKDLEVKELP